MKWGYRLYTDGNGQLRFDQIANGSVYSLVPADSDHDLPLGYYDAQMQYIGDNPPGDDDDTPEPVPPPTRKKPRQEGAEADDGGE